MKILILANNARWKTLNGRVVKLQTYLSKRLKPIHGTVEIEVKHTSFDVPHKDKVDPVWFQTIVSKKHEATCLLIDRDDWNGPDKHLGHFYRTGQKINFYVVADEFQKVKRTDGKRYFVLEDTFEHELCHALFHDLGLPDLTHYYWYDKGHAVDELWNDLYDGWAEKDKVFAGLLDKMKVSFNYYGLLPLVARTAQMFIKDSPVAIKITEGYRTPQRQDELYAQGRTKPGSIVTNARGGESFHNFRVAFDVYPLVGGYNSERWEELGAFGESLGLEWGGRWPTPDRPHFELKLGHTLKDFQSGKVDLKKFD